MHEKLTFTKEIISAKFFQPVGTARRSRGLFQLCALGQKRSHRLRSDAGGHGYLCCSGNHSRTGKEVLLKNFGDL